MALCNSGSMSLGGSTTGRSVNCELGRSGTSSINMNESDVRNLAGRPSGSICMSNFYGASSGPETLGELFEGGYYLGTFGGYYLLVAPNAGGCTGGPSGSCKWKTTTSCSSSTGTTNGYTNTYGRLANSTHPAGNWTATRSLSGKTDWYLPATCEQVTLYNNCSSAPPGQGWSTNYWTSTEVSAFPGYRCACTLDFRFGNIAPQFKLNDDNVRAIRRESF